MPKHEPISVKIIWNTAGVLNKYWVSLKGNLVQIMWSFSMNNLPLLQSESDMSDRCVNLYTWRKKIWKWFTNFWYKYIFTLSIHLLCGLPLGLLLSGLLSLHILFDLFGLILSTCSSYFFLLVFVHLLKFCILDCSRIILFVLQSLSVKPLVILDVFTSTLLVITHILINTLFCFP